LVLLISDFIQLVAVGKVDEQVGDVTGDVGVWPPEMFRKTLLGQGAKQLTERMPWRNLRSHIPLSHIPKTYEFSIADDSGCAKTGSTSPSFGLHESDLSTDRKLQNL
jgi:hypothetical protein